MGAGVKNASTLQKGRSNPSIRQQNVFCAYSSRMLASKRRYFLTFLVMTSQVHPSFKSGHLISKYRRLFLKVSLILISHLNTFLLYNHPLFFLSSLTLLRLSMAKSKISLGKCYIALENTWVVLKYLFILMCNVIPVYNLVYSAWDLEQNLYPAIV